MFNNVLKLPDIALELQQWKHINHTLKRQTTQPQAGAPSTERGSLSKKPHFAVFATRRSTMQKPLKNRVSAHAKVFQWFSQSLFAFMLSRFLCSRSVCCRPRYTSELAQTAKRACHVKCHGKCRMRIFHQLSEHARISSLTVCMSVH